jgi:hypothetical protein
VQFSTKRLNTVSLAGSNKNPGIAAGVLQSFDIA